MSLHTYTKRLGFPSDLKLLQHYHDAETILQVLIDCVPETLEVIHEMIEEAVFNDVNIYDEFKVIE